MEIEHKKYRIFHKKTGLPLIDIKNKDIYRTPYYFHLTNTNYIVLNNMFFKVLYRDSESLYIYNPLFDYQGNLLCNSLKEN